MSIRLGEDEHVGESDTEKINVVPLADLSLVLLIILMVMSPMIMQSMIQVMTPQVAKKAAKKNSGENLDPLMILVTKNGVKLNNTPLPTLMDLAVQITTKLTENSERPVLITAEPDVPVDDVVQVLDLAKQSGAEKVSLLKSPHSALAGSGDFVADPPKAGTPARAQPEESKP